MRYDLAITHHHDRNLILARAARFAHAAPFAGGALGNLRCPLKGSRKNVSSASTMPVSCAAWCWAAQAKKRGRQRKAVFLLMPHRLAALRTLKPSISAWA